MVWTPKGYSFPGPKADDDGPASPLKADAKMEGQMSVSNAVDVSRRGSKDKTIESNRPTWMSDAHAPDVPNCRISHEALGADITQVETLQRHSKQYSSSMTLIPTDMALALICSIFHPSVPVDVRPAP